MGHPDRRRLKRPLPWVLTLFEPRRSPKILSRVGIITKSLLMHKLLILFLNPSGVGWVQPQSLSPEVIAYCGRALRHRRRPAELDAGRGGHRDLYWRQVAAHPGLPPDPTDGGCVKRVCNGISGAGVPQPHNRPILRVEAPEAPQAFGLELLDGSAPGLYLLQLRSGDGQSIQSFKIIKHN